MAPQSNPVEILKPLTATARSFIPPSAPSSMITAAFRRSYNATPPRSSMAGLNGPSSTHGVTNEATSVHFRQLSYPGPSGCSSPISSAIDAGLSTCQDNFEPSRTAEISASTSQYVPGKRASSNETTPKLSILNCVHHATQSLGRPISQDINPNPSVNYHQTTMYHQGPSSPPGRVHYRPANSPTTALIEPSRVAQIIGESHVQWMGNRSRDSDEPVPMGSQLLLRHGAPDLRKNILPYEGSDEAAAAQIKFLQHALRVVLDDLKNLDNELAERRSKDNGDEEHCLNILARKAAGLFPDFVKDIQHLEQEKRARDDKLAALQRIYNIPEDEMSIKSKEDAEQEQHRKKIRQAIGKVADVRNSNPSETQRKRDEMQKKVHEEYRTRKATELTADTSQYIKPGATLPSPPGSPEDSLPLNLAPI